MEEQEIGLRDYINVIIKRKKIILAIFFISVITVAVISLLTPALNIYVATAVIQNGNIDGLLIAKAEVEEIIKSQSLLNPVIKKLNLEVDIQGLREAIKINSIENTDFFRLIVEYKGEETAVKICQEIANLYIAFGETIYGERIELTNGQLKEVVDHIKSVKDDIQNLRGTISQFSLVEKPGSEESGEVTSKREVMFLNYQVLLSSLIERKNELNLIQAKAKEFKVTDPPIRQKDPTKSKKRQNIIISAVVSLMFGVFLAFFMEYWEKSKPAQQ